MSKPLELRSYPPALQEMVVKLESGQPLSIRSPDEKMLKDLRFTFYAFRKAMKRDGSAQMFKNLDAIVGTIKLTFDNEFILTFSLSDNAKMFDALRSALSTSPSPAEIIATSVASESRSNHSPNGESLSTLSPTSEGSPALQLPLSEPEKLLGHHHDAALDRFLKGEKP